MPTNYIAPAIEISDFIPHWTSAVFVVVNLLVMAISIRNILRSIKFTDRLFWLAVVTLTGMLSAGFFGEGPFGIIRLGAIGVFGLAPVFLIVLSLAWPTRNVLIRGGLPIIAIVLWAVAFDAFWIEPFSLVVTKHTITHPKIKEPLRIVLFADIQTDRVTDYDAIALRRAIAEKPDLVLFGGDYLQMLDGKDWRPQADKLRSLLLEHSWKTKLGSFAIRGNTEPDEWRSLFLGTNINAVEDTTTFDLGSFELVCLSELVSFNTRTRLAGSEKFQIILGHAPNFFVGENQANLLLAGHTHGGQIQIPFLGPIFTLCKAPRKWATGRFNHSADKTSIVSRGIGMERGHAPRLRFWCRPEIVTIDLIPGK